MKNNGGGGTKKDPWSQNPLISVAASVLPSVATIENQPRAQPFGKLRELETKRTISGLKSAEWLIRGLNPRLSTRDELRCVAIGIDVSRAPFRCLTGS